MKFKEITSVNELPSVMKLFEGGAKLLSLEYIACGKDSITNDVKDAILKFKGGTEFALRFAGVECLHIAPIAMGNIYVENISLGKFRNIYFWADDDTFNITEPDTSGSYCIASSLSVGRYLCTF